jgi:predicted ATPase
VISVRRIAIRNFRAIEALELGFSEGPGWTMLLGDNGDGKSSVLQALAVALMDSRQRRRLKTSDYLRDGAKDGSITVEVSDPDGEVQVAFDRSDERFHVTGGRPALVASYVDHEAPAGDALIAELRSRDAAEGVVLIDDLGAHLHPRRQMRVVGALREALPGVQFVASTYEPLCLRGLRDGEVVVLRRDEQQRIQAVTDLPSIAGLDVDQLLTSELFGLRTTLDPELEARFDEYYALLAKHEPTRSEQDRIAELRESLAEHRQFGRTARERLVFEAADEALARKRRQTRDLTGAALTDEAKERIAQLWTDAEL